MSRNHRGRVRPLTLIEFQEKFGTEEACMKALIEARWPNGWICPRCGKTRYYSITGRRLFECADCRYQSSVTAGTILHKTRTSLQIWFLIMYLVVTDKRGISSVALAQRVGKSQKNAWTLLQKLRCAMGECNEKRRLTGLVQIQERFLKEPREGGPRYPRSVQKCAIVVALSEKPNGGPKFIRMSAVEAMDRNTLKATIHRMVEPGSFLGTNGFRAYGALQGEGFVHQIKSRTNKTPAERPWMAVVLGNLTVFIAGTYHGVWPHHMQAYLDEYTFRFNRRGRQDLLSSLVRATMTSRPRTYRVIVGDGWRSVL